jgi:hypothetical protein
MKPSQWIERRDDEVLAVHKAQPGREWGGIILTSAYSLLLAGMMICSPFMNRVPMSRTQVALAVGAGLGILVAGQALAAFLYAKAARGVWVIDSRQIEFRPRRGQGCRLSWMDVGWVRWGRLHFALRGDGKSIGLERGLLDDGDWKAIRDRVETVLSGRFDLAIKPAPPQEIRWLPVLGVAAPAALLTGLLLLTLPRVSERLTAVFVLVHLILLLAMVVSCFIKSHRDYQRLNPTWRPAKSKAGAWEDWSC